MPNSVDSFCVYKAVEDNAARVATSIRKSSCFRSLRMVKEWVCNNYCPRSLHVQYSQVGQDDQPTPEGYRLFRDVCTNNVPLKEFSKAYYSSDEEVDVSLPVNSTVVTQPVLQRRGDLSSSNLLPVITDHKKTPVKQVPVNLTLGNMGTFRASDFVRSEPAKGRELQADVSCHSPIESAQGEWRPSSKGECYSGTAPVRRVADGGESEDKPIEWLPPSENFQMHSFSELKSLPPLANPGSLMPLPQVIGSQMVDPSENKPTSTQNGNGTDEVQSNGTPANTSPEGRFRPEVEEGLKIIRKMAGEDELRM